MASFAVTKTTSLLTVECVFCLGTGMLIFHPIYVHHVSLIPIRRKRCKVPSVCQNITWRTHNKAPSWCITSWTRYKSHDYVKRTSSSVAWRVHAWYCKRPSSSVAWRLCAHARKLFHFSMTCVCVFARVQIQLMLFPTTTPQLKRTPKKRKPRKNACRWVETHKS